MYKFDARPRLLRGFTQTVGDGVQYTSMTMIMSAVSGILLVLIFPKFNFSLLAWVSLVPLLFASLRCTAKRQSFLVGLCSGLIYFAGVLYWIPHVVSTFGGLHPVLAYGVYLLLASGLALFISVFSLTLFFIYRSIKDRALLFVPLIWVTLEFARNHLFINGFPWCLLGYSQFNNAALIQIADITGIYGISFLIACVNALIVYAVLSANRRALLLTAISAAATVGVPMIYGHFKLKHAPSEPGSKSVNVACIQGNVPMTDNMERLAEKFLVEYPKLIQAAAASNPQLVILPESPTPFSYEDSRYRQLIDTTAKINHVALLFNSTATAPSRQEDFFNSAYLVSSNGEFVSRYDKIHLVPFGEYVPLRNALFFAGKVLNEIGDFKPGNKFLVSEFEAGRFGTLICFESIFPELAREFVKQGAEFLVVITNDSWYGYSAAPYQHLIAAIFRAVENRRYVVRAANGGISAIIDPHGRIVEKSDLYTETIVKGTLTLNSELTFYTRFADVFAWFCVIIVGSAVAYCSIRRK